MSARIALFQAGLTGIRGQDMLLAQAQGLHHHLQPGQRFAEQPLVLVDVGDRSGTPNGIPGLRLGAGTAPGTNLLTPALQYDPTPTGDCEAIQQDATRLAVTWKGKSDIRQHARKVVRLKFEMQHAKLFAFEIEKKPTTSVQSCYWSGYR